MAFRWFLAARLLLAVAVSDADSGENCSASADAHMSPQLESLLQSSARLKAGMHLQSSNDGVLNAFANMFGGSEEMTLLGAGADTSQSQSQATASTASSESAASSSTQTLLAQIKKQAEEAVTDSRALPPLAKELLANFSVEVQNMLDGLMATHNESQQVIIEAYAQLEACDDHWNNKAGTIDVQNYTSVLAEGDHANCRNSVGQNSSAWCNGLKTIVNRMHSDPANCTVPDPRLQDQCVAAPTIRPFIESIKLWAQDYLDEYVHQKKGCEAALKSDDLTRVECDTLQGRFEGEMCALDNLVNVTIQSYESCRRTETAELEIVGIKNNTNEVNKNEYIALKKIECYLTVLLNYDGPEMLDAQKAKLELCNTFVVDTSMFDLYFPEEVPPLDFSAVTSQLSPKPGDPTWITVYDPFWGITAPVTTCVVA